MRSYVYRHIRLDKNQPFYIGIGKCDNYNYRRAYSKNDRNDHWVHIVSKTEYEIEILLDDLSREEAIQKEIEFINLYGKSIDGGILCNISDGGLGGDNGIESNLKKSIKLKGHHVSEETRKKLRQKAIGRNATEDTKKKMSDIRKNKKIDWINANGHLNGNSKKVYQYTLDGKFIKMWECSAYACKELCINKSSLSEASSGKQKTAGGFLWRKYYSEFI